MEIPSGRQTSYHKFDMEALQYIRGKSMNIVYTWDDSPASHVWWTEGTPISEGHHFEPEPKTNIRLVRRQHKKGKWLRHNLDTTTCHNHQTTNPHPKLYNGSGSLKHHDSYPLLLIYPISIPKHQNEMMEFCRKIVIRPPHPSKSPRKKQQHKSQNCFSMTQWIIILYIYIIIVPICP